MDIIENISSINSFEPITQVQESTSIKLFQRLEYISEVIEKVVAIHDFCSAPAHLVHRSQDGSIEDLALRTGASYVIGREQTQHFKKIQDPSLSRKHMRFHSEGGIWWVEDLGSSNSTIVNDCKISDLRALCSGDLVVAGRSVFVFILTENDPLA